MIYIKLLNTAGIPEAIHAMRNPKNSWDRSDSDGDCVGDHDMLLMHRLSSAGVEHRTFARMMVAWIDVSAPLYWWKEMDRYTIGKAQVSCSTMHKITEKEFTLDDFSTEHLYECSLDTMTAVIDRLNLMRERYKKLPNKDDWWQLIQLLPSSYNQTRTVMLSYEVCLKILHERSSHKLDEWKYMCNWLRNNLPYLYELEPTGGENRQ